MYMYLYVILFSMYKVYFLCKVDSLHLEIVELLIVVLRTSMEGATNLTVDESRL